MVNNNAVFDCLIPSEVIIFGRIVVRNEDCMKPSRTTDMEAKGYLKRRD